MKTSMMAEARQGVSILIEFLEDRPMPDGKRGWVAGERITVNRSEFEAD